MKKIVMALLTGIMVLSFAACGNSQTNTEPAQEETQSQSTESTGEETPSQNAESTDDDTQTQADTAQDHEAEDNAKVKVAKDGADMQTEDKTMPTRKPMEGGTKINMYFGDTLITGVLNDSETAQALIKKLPVTQHVNRYSHDFCGVTEDLPYKEEDVHYGWLNGDIDYATDAPYFTILFEDEEVSEQFGYQVNIGVITTPLSEIAALEGSFDVRIELAE